MTGPNGVTSTMPLELPPTDARLNQARDSIAKGQPAAALPPLAADEPALRGDAEVSVRPSRLPDPVN